MKNNYAVIYRGFLDVHKRNKEKNALRYAFEDTVHTIVVEEQVTTLAAKEWLNSLMPMINNHTKHRENA